MKTKPTQNRINDFVIIHISKLTLLITSSFFQRLAFLTYILLFNSTITFAQGGSCSADFKVDKDRNERSVPPEGTYYSVILTNNSSSPDTFSLSSLNINSSCSNSDGSSTLGNVDLSISFADADLNPITTVSLNPSQSVNFFVHITVPVGTPINKWCCTQVIAESNICSNYKVNTVLHTLVINPNDD